MPLAKLNLTIPQEGYSVTDGESVLRAQLSGGPSRQRLDMIGAPSIVDITLYLEAVEYAYWRAFYRTAIVEGSLPFLIDLVIDDATMIEHEAKIIPGSVKLASIQGDAHVVQLQLEVKMPIADSDYDTSLVMIYDTYGGDADDILNLLAKLVNIDLPANLM